MKLRKIAPMPFPDIEFREVEGRKPQMKWVAPTSLLVDAIYQRDLSDRSIRLIKKMIATFSWNRLKPPIVVEVSGGYHIVDGQHTAIVAATLEIPEIPIFIVEAETLDERARAFVGHNSDRLVVSPFDIYRALVASGDPSAVQVDKVCKAAGVRIRYISPSSVLHVGGTAAIQFVRRLVEKRGAELATTVLSVLVAAKRSPLGVAELQAVDHILCVERPGVSTQALTRVVRGDGDAGIEAARKKARAERTSCWIVLKNRWVRKLGAA